MNSKIMNVAVIGAGPAGLTCALKLAEAGIHVDVYESDSTVGGMTKSFELWGQQVDLGPHRFFSKDERINNFWLEQVGKDYIMVDRLTRIYYNKKFFVQNNLFVWRKTDLISSRKRIFARLSFWRH